MIYHIFRAAWTQTAPSVWQVSSHGEEKDPFKPGRRGVEARCCECTLWLMLEARHWRSQHAYFLSSVQSSWETLCAVAAGTFWSLAYLKTEKKQTPQFHFMNQTNEQNNQRRKKLQSEFSCQGLMALSLSFVVVPNKLNILKAQGH